VFNMKKVLIHLLVGLLLGMTACSAQTNSTNLSPVITPSQSTLSFIPSSMETPNTSVPLLPLQPTPQNIIGGGRVQEGLFIFDLNLFREADLNQLPVATSLYSDMNGIGAYMYWIYQRVDLIGPVETYWGTLPHFDQLHQETYSSITHGSSGGRTGGILLPGGFFLSGASKVGDLIQIGLKVHTPNGDNGAVLDFTLAQGSKGFEPVDISVKLLPSGW
jgi:hypothetical protein